MWDDLRLICSPPDDTLFAERVRTLIAELRGRTSSEAELVAAVLNDLRREYPNIRIRSRDPIAEFSPEQAIWYVYRDGHPAGDEHPAGQGPDVDGGSEDA